MSSIGLSVFLLLPFLFVTAGTSFTSLDFVQPAVFQWLPQFMLSFLQVLWDLCFLFFFTCLLHCLTDSQKYQNTEGEFFVSGFVFQ